MLPFLWKLCRHEKTRLRISNNNTSSLNCPYFQNLSDVIGHQSEDAMSVVLEYTFLSVLAKLANVT